MVQETDAYSDYKGAFAHRRALVRRLSVRPSVIIALAINLTLWVVMVKIIESLL